jgi:crotonobetainyl-CoA:carnitine CoA-transferase CaiB-like acyl-CoA transferase
MPDCRSAPCRVDPDEQWGRIDQREWFWPALQDRLGRVKKAGLMALAEKAGIPFAPEARPQGLFEDPHLNQSESLAETDLPGGGVAKLPKIPLRMDRSGFDLRLNPPGIGEGSLAVYRQCGFSTAEIRSLADQGVIELVEAERSAVG